MNIKFKNYKMGEKIVSLALDACTRIKLEENGLPLIYADIKENTIILLPENLILSRENDNLNCIRQYNNYDVFKLCENGMLIRQYNDRSDDNCFFITGKCNSNCLMCPSPEYSRRNSETAVLENLLEIAEHIPSDVYHLTITGGEPFLMGEKIFSFIHYLKDRFSDTEFLFLTNGRIFALEKYLQCFCEAAPNNSIVAIPIHGSYAQLHDAITRSKGSFEQTFIGIKHLLKKNISVEIRLVVSKLNIYDLNHIAELIVNEFGAIKYVSIIAMEMTGTARSNADLVWIPYRESFRYVSDAVRILIENEIDVKLYNFPLCTVDKAFWTLCEKSISDYKVRFADECDRCRYKRSCCGVFAGTLQLEKNELRPIP